MKKAIASLLAVSAALSIGVTAFAEDINTDENTALLSSFEESSTESGGSSSGTESEGGNSGTESGGSNSGTESEGGSSDSGSTENPIPDGIPTAIVLSPDEDGIELGKDLLEPGVEYKFPVSIIINQEPYAMNDALAKKYKFTYSRLSGTGMKTFEIDDHKGVYYLYVEVKDTTPNKEIDVKYNLKMVDKSNNKPIVTQEIKFSYGYEEMESDYISGLDKGDIVEIDNSNPVITDSQFDKIARINDYKNVTLSGTEWQFTVNVTDEKTKNMVSTNAGSKDILSKFPEQDFKFYTFSGKPQFSATGKMALDVEDIMDDFDKMYTYRYAGGKIYRLNATFNEEDNTLEFRTNRLDTFFVTDKAIKDGTVVSDVENDKVDDENEGNEQEKPGNDTDKNNPGTGASDMINAAVMAAIASLGTVGAVAAKKYSK